MTKINWKELAGALVDLAMNLVIVGLVWLFGFMVGVAL